MIFGVIGRRGKLDWKPKRLTCIIFCIAVPSAMFLSLINFLIDLLMCPDINRSITVLYNTVVDHKHPLYGNTY